MALYSSTIINYHLDAIQGLMMAIMDNNNRLLRILENKLSASSMMIPEASAHRNVVVSLDNKCELEEISATKVDSDLDNGLSSPADDSEVPIETMGTKSNEEEHLKSYACQVFAEIPSRNLDMKVEDSVKNHSVEHENQVFDEMIHTISAVECDYSDCVMFDNQLALPCVLSACSHNQRPDRGIFDYLSGIDHAKHNLSLHHFTFDQFGLEFPFDPGSSSLSIFRRVTRNYIICSASSDLGPDKFIMSTLRNSCIEPLKLDLRNTVDAYKWVTTNCGGKNIHLRIIIGDPSFIASCEWSGVDSGLDFPCDPGSNLPFTYVGATRNFVFCDTLGSLKRDKCMSFTQWNACIMSLNFPLQYIATVYRWVITSSVCSKVLIGIAIHDFHRAIDDVVALDEQGAFGEWPLGLPTKDSLVADDKRNNIAAYVHLMVRVGSFFIHLPKNALDIKVDKRLGMAKNLRWLRDIFTDEDVYFYVLLFESTTSYISHKLDELLFHFKKKILKTFLMVSSSRHSWCAIDSFLIKALVHSYFLYYGSITVATFHLHLPRIFDSLWVAGDGMKKNGYYRSHSWDYTRLCEEHQIWKPNVDIAFICEKLQLVYHFLIIKLSTQNILSNQGAIKLHQFPLASSATMYIVSLGGIVLLNCVWDPGINSKTMNLYVHTEVSEAQLLLGSRGNFCFCVYSDSMTKVWDPGRQRDISSHSTDLAKGRVKYGIYHLTYSDIVSFDIIREGNLALCNQMDEPGMFSLIANRFADTFISWVSMCSKAHLPFFMYLWCPKTKKTTCL